LLNDDTIWYKVPDQLPMSKGDNAERNAILLFMRFFIFNNDFSSLKQATKRFKEKLLKIFLNL